MFSMVSLILVQGVTAQRGFDPKAMAAREKAMLYKKAEGLSDDQKLLIEGIYEEYALSVEEIRDEVRKTRNWQEFRPKMMALREEKTLLMKDLLNDQQYAVYADMMDDQEKQMQQRQQQRQPPTQDPN